MIPSDDKCPHDNICLAMKGKTVFSTVVNFVNVNRVEVVGPMTYLIGIEAGSKFLPFSFDVNVSDGTSVIDVSVGNDNNNNDRLAGFVLDISSIDVLCKCPDDDIQIGSKSSLDVTSSVMQAIDSEEEMLGVVALAGGSCTENTARGKGGSLPVPIST